jgi:hypothetical protein
VAVAVLFCAIAIPLTFSDGLEGLAIGLSIATAGGFALRVGYIARLFPGHPIAILAVRALAPSAPAVGIVLLARALESGERTAGLALAELAAYLVITAAATWALERNLIREAIGYLRGGGGSNPVAPAAA